MIFNPDIHHRHSIRLKDYDYSQAGAYFVTLCAWQRECLFGDFVDGKMRLNELGQVVESVWCGLIRHFANLDLDQHVIMPNHFHGILQINDTANNDNVGAKQGSSALPGFDVDSGKGEAGETLASPLQNLLHGTVSGSFAAAVQNFKSVSTRKINKIRQNLGCPVWQRNYYERVIRNDAELERAREYIINNPLKWKLDKENPANQQQPT
ncbi:MAG TPA: transposase [Desulfuromonadales bacterium]|nr:transposase [Desulfuromonadales bacterium]